MRVKSRKNVKVVSDPSIHPIVIAACCFPPSPFPPWYRPRTRALHHRRADTTPLSHTTLRPGQPPAVAEAAGAIVTAHGKGDEDFLRALRGFEWRDEYQSRFERGEFSHWLELFNLFDEWFERHVRRHTFTLDWEDEKQAPEGPFPAATCLEVLRVSRAVLENCASKHAYGSLDHLACLLAAQDPEVVRSTLQTLVTLSRRSFFQSTSRWHHGNAELYTRVFSMAQGWGGSDSLSSMRACIQQTYPSELGEPEPPGAPSYDLHFEFYRDEEAGEGKHHKGHQVIHLKASHPALSKGTNLEACERVTKEFGVPQKLRFALLNRLRIIRSLGTREGRQECVRMRLTAFHILFQSSPDHEDLPLLLGEPGLVQDLLDVLYNEGEGCEDLRNLAAKALASMCCDRSRQNLFLRTLNSGRQKEKFVLFLKTAISRASPGGERENGLLESLLSLVSVLSVSTLGCAILSQLGLVQILVDMLKLRPGPQRQIISGAVRVLEALMERDAAVMRAFREFDGLQAIIGRLSRELGLVEGGDEEMVPGDSEAQRSSAKAGGALAKRFLIKSLLRASALACYNGSEWTQSRLIFEGETEGLPKCLEAVFKQGKDLGSSVFALAATIMGDFLHHDPTCFPVIEKHGLPEAFLGSVKTSLVVTPDTVCCIPSTLVALCLNKKGLKAVQDSGALGQLASIFTNPAHCRSLQGDTPSLLGNGLDELVRHVPEMKGQCIEVVFSIVDKILDVSEQLKEEQAAKAATNEGEASVPMETGAGAKATEVYFDSMSEIVSNTARLLEALLSNPAVAEAFVGGDGVRKLLKFYSIPVKSQTSTNIHQLFSTFRVLYSSHVRAKEVGTCLVKELEVLLEDWEGRNDHTRVCSYMLEDHLARAASGDQASGLRDRPTLGTLHALEGLLSLSGNLLRSSSMLVTGFSLDFSAKLLGLLGKFQSHMIWSSCLFEAVRKHRESREKEKQGECDGSAAGVRQEGKEAPTLSRRGERENPLASWDGIGFPPRVSRRGPAAAEVTPKRLRTDAFHEVVNRVLASIRQLFQALARNMQTERGLRREGARLAPRKQAFESAASLARLSLARVTFDYLHYSEADHTAIEKLAIDVESSSANGFPQTLSRQVKLSFLSQCFEETSSLLQDPRRKTSNTLLVNAFIRGNVLSKTLDCLADQVAMLTGGQNWERDELREELSSLTRVILKMLAFVGAIGKPSLLLASTQTSNLLRVKFPEEVMSTVFKDCANFVEVEIPQDSHEFFVLIQRQLLERVAWVWRAGLRTKLPHEVISTLLVIFHNAAHESKDSSLKEKSIKEKKFMPSEAVIEQILAMGFTRRQAENALNKVKSNNVEVAMEWILNHPEEETPETRDELSRALALSKDEKEGKKADGKPSMQDVWQMHMPSVEDFLDVFFNSLEDKEETIALSFAIVEVLVRILTISGDKAKENAKCAVDKLMAKLSDTSDLHTFAALHMLLLLSCKDELVRHRALECGVVPACLDLLKGQGKRGGPRPRWISPLFLLVDCYLKMTFNPLKGLDAGSSEGLASAFEDLKRSGLHLDVATHACETLRHICKKDAEEGDKKAESLRKELCQASLQVISTVCRDHAIALKLYKMGIVDTLLCVPLECQFPALECLVFSILRCIVEDPVTLQKSMEMKIRKILTSKLPSPLGNAFRSRPNGAPVELKSVMQHFVPFYVRDKDAFRAAISSVCALEKKDGKVSIKLLSNEVCTAQSSKNQGKKAAEGVTTRSVSNNGKGSVKSALTVFPEVVQMLLTHIVGNTMLLTDKVRKEDKEAQRRQNWLHRSIGMCISVLTEFIVHYPVCIQHIMKAEPDLRSFGFIIDNLLHLQSLNKVSLSMKSGTHSAVIAEKSSLFLVAVCSHSLEARRKILAHIVHMLMGLTSHSDAMYKPMDVTKLKAIVDFIHSLLTSIPPLNSSAKKVPGEDSHWSKDLREFKLVDGLICAINNIELHNPGVPRILSTILRPLNVILEFVNRSAMLERLEEKAKKGGSGGENKSVTTSQNPGAIESNLQNPAIPPTHQLPATNPRETLERIGMGIGYSPFQSGLDYESGLASRFPGEMDDYSSDAERTPISAEYSMDDSDSDMSDSSSTSGSMSSSISSSSGSDMSDSSSFHNSDGEDAGDGQHEGYEVVVSRVNGEAGADHEDNGINGHASGSADPEGGYHPHSTLLRVSEVEMDGHRLSLSSDRSGEDPVGGMMDEEEDFMFHERDGESEEEWSDSPVIEVRVRSPFQMRANWNPRDLEAGPAGSRETVGLQAGIPILENFFGAIGVFDDGVLESLQAGPRRLQNLTRYMRGSSGLHPLYNPLYDPTGTRAAAPAQETLYRPVWEVPSVRGDYTDPSSGFPPRGQPLRPTDPADPFASSFSLDQPEAQNNGFEVFGPTRNDPNDPRGGAAAGRTASSGIKRLELERTMERLVTDCLPVEKVVRPELKQEAEAKPKQKKEEEKGKEEAPKDPEPEPKRKEEAEEEPRADQTAAQTQDVAGTSSRAAAGPEQHRPSTPTLSQAVAGISNIDPAFLEALPEDLRQEVLAQGLSRPSPAERGSGVRELVEAQESPQDLDPEFLAALPADIQNEVLAQQRQARVARDREAATSGAEMDIASIIATFPPEIREEVLLTLDESAVNSLPSDILAEARTIRDRVNSRSFQTYTFGQENSYSAVTQSRSVGAFAEGAARARASLQGRLLQRGGGGDKKGGLSRSLGGRREILAGHPPPISAHGVASLVRLLRVASTPNGKGLMHKVVMNVCAHPESCRSLLSCFSEILSHATQKGRSNSSASAADDQASGRGARSKGQYSLYGCQGDAHLAQRSSYRVPSLLLERVLGLLTYLVRHDPQLSLWLLSAPQKRRRQSSRDRKGKAAAKREDDLRERTTIAEQLLRLLQREFQSNGGLFDPVLQLFELVLSRANRLMAEARDRTSREQAASKAKEEKKPGSERRKDEDGAAKAAEGEKKATKVPEEHARCQQVLQSLFSGYLEQLPKYLSACSERSSSSHLQKVMSHVCVMLPPKFTNRMVEALSEEGARVAKECEGEVRREISEKDSAHLTLKSGFVLLKLASKIKQLESQERRRRPAFELCKVAGFTRFQESAAGLWVVLGRQAETLEASLRRLTSKEGDVPIASQSILPYFPVVECFAILSGSGGDKKPKKPEGNESASLSFVAFAEKHSLLVNSLIRHDPSCLEENFKVLLDHPRLIEFENKCAYFRGRINKEEDHHHSGSMRLNVRRDCVFEDSFHQLRHRTTEEMRGRLNVQFQGEDGVDAGGLTREWYQVMARAIFKEELALFTSGGNGITFQPNPNSMIQNEGVDHLQYFKFVGRFVAKALMDCQILDAYFTRPLYKHLLGEPLSYEDIEAVDPDYFKNLKWMLCNDIEGVFDLTFTAEADYFDKKSVVELKPGGAEIAVTNENKQEYVNLVAKHRMTSAIEPQIKAFLEGFWELIGKDLLEIFTEKELELIISGTPTIDVADLKANTEYNGYYPSSKVVLWFWEILGDLGREDLARLVQFITGTSKVPLEGFKALQGVNGPQKFQIHKSFGSTSLLPTSHTCFNQLDLPEYESKEQLKDRLLIAVREGAAGFGLA